jgi:hypothetical protein
MYEYRVAYKLQRKGEDPVEFASGPLTETMDPVKTLADYRRAKRCTDVRLERREVGDWEQVEVTKTGKILDNADFEALADEAEEGYDVSQLKERRG